VVRLPIKGQIAARGIDLIGKVSDAEEAQSRLVLTVRLDTKQSGDMPHLFRSQGLARMPHLRPHGRQPEHHSLGPGVVGQERNGGLITA
jgi:hypothetical protein